MFVETPKVTQTWECKECHHRISDAETVAYRLINGVLYGWCSPCFSKRHQPAAKVSSKPPAPVGEAR